MVTDNRVNSQFSISRLFEVLFASWAVSIGGSILAFVVGIMLFGVEVAGAYIENYFMHTLLSFAVIAFPFVWKRLK